MSPEQEERLVCAFESIAATLMSYNLAEHPPKKLPTEPTVTYLKTEEEQLREELGDTGEETNEDWLNLGPRERAFIEKEKQVQPAGARQSPSTGTGKTRS